MEFHVYELPQEENLIEEIQLFFLRFWIFSNNLFVLVFIIFNIMSLSS